MQKKALWVTQGFNPPMADKYQEQLSDAAKGPDFGTARKRNTV
jgi:hypothetical protein